MITVIRLIISILLPVIASTIIYLLDRKTIFRKIHDRNKQIIIGTVFGLIAISATEQGIPLDGAVLNVRNASPLTAGLIFGWQAGLISGFIGGIERFLTPTGDFTRIACTLGTIIAGFIGAGIRRFILDNKKSSWFYGFLIGIVTEVIHMLMVFLNNGGDIQRAFRIVEICAIPMILSNGISVMLSILTIIHLSDNNNKYFLNQDKKNISQTFQFWLFVCVVLAFTATIFFTNAFQKSMAQATAEFTLKGNLKDIKKDIKEVANRRLIDLSWEIARKLPENPTSTYLEKLCSEYNLAEVNLINKDGIITQSSEIKFIGFDMTSNNQTKEFLVLLNDKKEFVQDKRNKRNETSLGLKYVGISLDNGFLEIGFSEKQYQLQVDEDIVYIAKYRHIGQNGSVIICNSKGAIVSNSKGNIEQNISIFKKSSDTKIKISPEVCFSDTINEEECLCMYTVFEGYYILTIMPKNEAFFIKKASVYMLAFMEIIVFTILFIAIFILIKKLIVQNIRKINKSLSKIANGDLNITIDVRDNEEFASLSNDINSTVETLKQYIEEAKARFSKDLEIAKQIQHSSLPSVFPPYPNRKDFSIFANMYPAKEVGGDFYDFYLVDENHLAFVIADVSGKGIPGAMFMMTSKTLIKSHTESGLAVNDVFTNVNTQLCENNEAGMFVTAWMGILDLKTGIVKFANAGHNPPLIKHADGTFEYLKSKANFVLAGMDGIRYKEQEIQLEKGDKIYLYTDGVTEAHNDKNELYGEDRLLKCLNSVKDKSVDDICQKIKEDVELFVGTAEQFDDITMLCVSFNEKTKDISITVNPTMETVSQIAAFVEEEMEKLEISPKISMKLMIAVDEIYSNIIRYSGATEATIKIEKIETELCLWFIDNGKPYNPLDAEEPDITTSSEDRKIGGLGIFMVRKMLNNVEYKYIDGKNILKLTKVIE